jgi:hypothetical protein
LFNLDNQVLAARVDILEFLRDKFGVTHECFASPLNAVLSYNSAFYDTDHAFGSQGNFFTNFHATQGRYEVNPPWEEVTLYMCVKHLHGLLELANESEHILEFYCFFPNWVDSGARALLLEKSEFLREDVLIPATNKHRRTAYYNPRSGDTLDNLAESRFFVLASAKAFAARDAASRERLNRFVNMLVVGEAGTTKSSSSMEEEEEVSAPSPSMEASAPRSSSSMKVSAPKSSSMEASTPKPEEVKETKTMDVGEALAYFTANRDRLAEGMRKAKAQKSDNMEAAFQVSVFTRWEEDTSESTAEQILRDTLAMDNESQKLFDSLPSDEQPKSLRFYALRAFVARNHLVFSYLRFTGPFGNTSFVIQLVGEGFLQEFAKYLLSAR